MSLGTAIFLSSFVLAVVILYGITKDRWRWRTVVKRIVLTIVGIVALLGAVIGGVYLWDQRPLAHAQQTEYAGLRLGMGPDEVMYIKGFPPSVLGEAPGGPGPFDDIRRVVATKNLEKGKRVKDYQDWLYESGSKSRIQITFNPEKTAVAAIQCFSDSSYECPSILGVSDGYSEQEVVQRLGNPGSSRIKGLAKYMGYPELGVHLALTKEKVYLISVAAPKLWPELNSR